MAVEYDIPRIKIGRFSSLLEAEWASRFRNTARWRGMQYVGDRDSWRDFVDDSLLISLEVKPAIKVRPQKCPRIHRAIRRAISQSKSLLIVAGSPWQWQPVWLLWAGERLYRASAPDMDKETPSGYVRRLIHG